ncbi:MAG: ABC transporter substrate-binding protein [Chloroflexi bacterium]|nr:ABC transporter substrate-binding protein [Chloroflexota bacterium]
MKHRRYIVLAICVLVVALLATPILGACAPQAPAKEKVLKVGYLIDLTGPVSVSLGKNTLATWLSNYRELNDRGGINGVRVDVAWEDYAFNVDRAVAAYKKFKDGGAVVVHPITTLAAEAIQPLSTRDKIPLVGNSTTDKLVDPTQWHYTLDPTYTQMFASIIKYVKENWKDTSRKPRIAQIAWDAPIGRGHKDASEAYAKQLGVDLGPWEFIPLIPLDTTPNLLRIRDAKVDFVVLQFGNNISATSVLRDAKKLGMLDKVTWINGFQNVNAAVGNWEEVGDGTLGISDTVFGEETNVAGVNALFDTLGKYIAPEAATKKPYFDGTTGLITRADLVVIEALTRAVTKVGYAKVDGQAVKDALETFKNYDTKGLTAPLTFGPTQRQGQSSLRFFKLDFKAKQWKAQTDWIQSPAQYDAAGKVIFK